MTNLSTDILVIGGGLAGSMAALRLAQGGCQVTLLERERGPHHKVCGEFLSREAVAYLGQAGVDAVSLGAETLRRVRLSTGRRIAEADLPFEALSLSRRVLDEAMLARAAQAGCNVVRGALVEALSGQENAWQVGIRDGQPWQAKTVFLANGKHDLRGLERVVAKPNVPALQADLVGFKLHLRLAPLQTQALKGWMELFLFPAGYGGISLVEGGVANLCLVVRQQALRKIGGWTHLLASLREGNRLLAERLHQATPLWERPLAVSSIPYGYLAGRGRGLWAVGDQAAVIPSFTGDGMSIALHSGALAAEMFLSGSSPAAYDRKLEAQLRRGMRLATTLSRAMVTDAGRAVARLGLAAFPSALAWIAAATRIPASAVALAGAESQSKPT
jgi:flavin-dependent dehydrogenase